MVSMATHHAILKNRVCLQIYSYLSSILSLNTIHGTKLNLRHFFHLVVRYANYLLCLFMNINKNNRNESEKCKTN